MASKARAVNRSFTILKTKSPAEILFLLERHPLFSTFDTSFLQFLSKSDIAELAKGDHFSPEKSAQDEDYYLLLDGKIDVFTETAGDVYLLDKLTAGSVFGNRFIGSAFVEIKENAALLIISKKKVLQMAPINPQAVSQLLSRLQAKTLFYLERINEKAVGLIRQKKDIGQLIILLSIFLTLFSFLLPTLSKVIREVNVQLLAMPLILAGGFFLLLHIRHERLPLATLGIHAQNLKRTLLEALILSIPLIGLIILFKFVAIQYLPQFQGKELFNPYSLRMDEKYGIDLTNGDVTIFALIYSAYVFFQAILVRGGLQGMFSRFFSTKWKNVLAIWFSSLVFASVYVYFGLFVVTTVFTTSLFLGWLYNRQKNLFGVTLAHILVGGALLIFIGPF